MGAKLSLQQETLPTTLMLNNESQSAMLWNQQVPSRWNTPYDELPSQIQNLTISTLSVIVIVYF